MSEFLEIDAKKLNNERAAVLNSFWQIRLLTNLKLAILAGGSLRKVVDNADEIVDYDLFFMNAEQRDKTKGMLETFGYRLVFACPQGELFTYKRKGVKVQMICKRFYTSIEDLLDSFDFTACQIALYDGKLYVTKQTIRDIKRKELRLNKIEYPVATLNRIQKYLAKGYKPSQEFYQSIVKAIEGQQWPKEQLFLYMD